MTDAGKLFTFLGLVFLVLGLIFNVVPSLPRLPGDISIEKPGIRIYIPFVSSLVISLILTVVFNYFRK